MKQLLLLPFIICIFSCTEQSRNEEPFPQTNYILTDIFVRYLEDTKECKSTVKLFTKNIMNKLIPDTMDYVVKINNVKMTKVQGTEKSNWYNFGEKIPENDTFKYTLTGGKAKDGSGYDFEVPMNYFGDISHHFEENKLEINWSGKPLLDSEQIVIIAANNKGGILTRTIEGPLTETKISLSEEDLVNISQGRADLYLVRKSRTKQGNDELGLNLNSEVYSKTIKINFPSLK